MYATRVRNGVDFDNLVVENIQNVDVEGPIWSNRARPITSTSQTERDVNRDMNQIDAAIAVVIRDAKVLVCQRKDGDTFGGYWEFPGGKQEDGETLHECLARELHEELAIRARPVAQLTTIEHNYPNVKLRLHPFVCEHEAGDVQHIECQASEWIDPPRLREYRFPPANESLIEEVVTYLAQRDNRRRR